VETSIVNNTDLRRVELHVDGDVAGFLAYELAGDVLSFTEIDTDLRRAGQGLGVELVRGALDAARSDGLSVLPVSSFVRDFIQRHPFYHDLVQPGERRRFGLPAATAA
jgi:predicted GNAT family acetyltransferase